MPFGVDEGEDFRHAPDSIDRTIKACSAKDPLRGISRKCRTVQ